MPATKAELCFCHLCTESEGGSLGRLIPRSQLAVHRKRAEADLAARRAHKNTQDEWPGAELVDDVTSKIFSLTLSSDSNPPPSRCFTSRNEIQETQRSANVFDASPISLTAILEGLNHLDIGDSRSSVVNQRDASETREDTENGLTGEEQRPQPTISKRDRSALTAKTLASLKHIEQHSQRLILDLNIPLPPVDLIMRSELELKTLQATFSGLRRQTDALDIKKAETRECLSLLEARLNECRALHPSIKTPLQVNTGKLSHLSIFTGATCYILDHYYQTPVDAFLPIAQVTMFLAVACSAMMGISRRFGDFLMKMLALNLCVAFDQTKTGDKLTFHQEEILAALPRTMATAMEQFDLDVKTTIYAVCDTCHCTYAPVFKHGSPTPIYPQECTNVPFPEADVCRTPLLKKGRNADGTVIQAPQKTFVYHHFHDYLAGLLSRKDIEIIMDNSCDSLTSSIKNKQPTPLYISDVFEGDFLRTFEGPHPGKLFVD